MVRGEDMQVLAEAKINWALGITGRRDNWHNLDTILDTVSLADTLDIEEAPGGIVVGDIEGVANMRDNLVWRAAETLARACGVTRGTRIEIIKKIPQGAGLGGGSADAAAALVALNALWHCGLSTEQLCALGLEIGSDVPYCVARGRVRAKGRGERFVETLGGPSYHLVVAKGETASPTVRVYARYDALVSGPSADVEGVARTLQAGNGCALALLLPYANALREAALDVCPQIADSMAALSDTGARAVFLTGSGSAALGLFESRFEAERADASLGDRVYFHAVVSTQ